MDLSSAPISQRLHISFFGCTNAGKSSLVNAFCNQDLSLVSEIKGTTTDPVKKTMELLPYGPVVIFDTAGLDDESELGKLRISKTLRIIDKTDIAILVIDATVGISKKDEELIKIFKSKNISYIVAYNKSDLVKNKNCSENEIYLSAKTGENIIEFKNLVSDLAKKIKQTKSDKFIIIDRLNKEDTVILVIPIDESAPKGRLILPQQLVLRELLDNHNQVICVQPQELKNVLNNLKTKPKLVITDSQVFNDIKDVVSPDIFLTSFSILFARYKGNLEILLQGAKKISELKKGAKILISEGCTHHRQCNDIGSVKFPKWLKEFRGYDFDFEFTSGGQYPNDLTKYDLVIHCGGCMLNEAEMISRINKTTEQKVNIVNYGMAIAYMNGILERAIEIL